MDRLTEMEAFATVVDQGGFTDAARKLGMSKSAVSKHVSSLEARLGAQLLNRTTRRVSPTEIGLVYYDRARRVLSDAGEADALVAALDGPPQGRLRLRIAADLAGLGIGRLIAAFIAEYPDVSVDLEFAAAGFALPDSDLPPDLVLGLGVPGRQGDGLHRLAETEMKMIAAPGYIQKFGHPNAIDDLRAHKLLHNSHRATDAVWSLRTRSGDERQIRTGGWLSVNDGRALLNACGAGLGIAYLPGLCCTDALRAGQVVEVVTDRGRDIRVLYAETNEASRAQPKLRAFLRFLEDALPDMGADGPR